MDVGRVGSLFIWAVESFLAGNAMRLTLTFKDPVDCGRLAESFLHLVKSHRTLRLRFEDGGWSSITDAEVENTLSTQAASVMTAADPDDVYSKYHPTNSGLPARIDFIDDYRVVFSLNHVYGNGRSALHYIEDLLHAYGGESGGFMPAGPPQLSSPSRPRRGAQAVSGLFWTAAYLASFTYRAGSRAGRATVDLSRGKSPGPPDRGYAVWTYLLTKEETEAALQRSTEGGLTVTENLCRVMAAALLEAQPEKTRVCISVPADLSAYLTGFSREIPGNFTGALIVQARRGAPLESQVRRAFRWARHGVHFWTPWLMGRLAGSETRLSKRFLRQARLPLPKRAPFENFSCAVSSVGVVQGRMSRKYLTSISAHVRTQTILFCAITLNDCMSIEVSVSNDLFDSAEVAGVTDCAIALFAGIRVAEAATKRIIFKEEAV